MQELMANLMLWLSLNTGYAIPEQLPNLAFTEPYNICSNYGIDHKGRCEASRVVAFYNTKQTIYLPLSFNQHSPDDKARLLHELIHYVQWKNGKHDNCRGLLEVEAYELQDKWLTQHNQEPGSDPFTLVMMAAACEE